MSGSSIPLHSIYSVPCLNDSDGLQSHNYTPIAIYLRFVNLKESGYIMDVGTRIQAVGALPRPSDRWPRRREFS